MPESDPIFIPIEVVDDFIANTQIIGAPDTHGNINTNGGGEIKKAPTPIKELIDGNPSVDEIVDKLIAEAPDLTELSFIFMKSVPQGYPEVYNYKQLDFEEFIESSLKNLTINSDSGHALFEGIKKSIKKKFGFELVYTTEISSALKKLNPLQNISIAPTQGRIRKRKAPSGEMVNKFYTRLKKTIALRKKK